MGLLRPAGMSVHRSPGTLAVMKVESSLQLKIGMDVMRNKIPDELSEKTKWTSGSDKIPGVEMCPINQVSTGICRKTVTV